MATADSYEHRPAAISLTASGSNSRSGRTMERRNPANLDEVVAIVPLSTREEVREAVAAAKAAFPAWRDTPAPARGRIIAKAAAIMTEQKEELPAS